MNKTLKPVLHNGNGQITSNGLLSGATFDNGSLGHLTPTDNSKAGLAALGPPRAPRFRAHCPPSVKSAKRNLYQVSESVTHRGIPEAAQI